MDVDDTARALAPATFWRVWIHSHPIAGAALVGLIATQVTTMIGYYLIGIGLPELPWADFNGFFLATKAEPLGSSGSFFGGHLMHMTDGVVFTILFGALVWHKIPLPNTTLGNIGKGVIYSTVLGLISIGFLIPYVYLRANHPSGFGGGLDPFSFGGPDGWKLPFAVLLWHWIWGYFVGVLYSRSDSRSV